MLLGVSIDSGIGPLFVIVLDGGLQAVSLEGVFNAR
jgi:hypothetical protein